MSDLTRDLIWGGAKLPTVTVVITCYNQAAFIEAAIRSVAQQTYPDFVCTVVDDLSTDRSAIIIRDILKELDDRRFSLLSHEQNQGQMAAMLSGADAHNGPFIAFLDGDDAWHPEFLSCHVNAHLNRNGAAGVSCSDMVLIDEHGAVLTGSHQSFRCNDPRRNSGLADAVAQFGDGDEALIFVPPGQFGWLWSGTSAMVYRRSIIDMLRPSSTDAIRMCADEYWAHAAQIVGGTVRLERRLSHYRLHDANGWANRSYLGDGFEIGVINDDVSMRIRLELAKRFCANAEEITKHVPKEHIATSLMQLVGQGELRKLCARDKTAYELVWAFLPEPTATKPAT